MLQKTLPNFNLLAQSELNDICLLGDICTSTQRFLQILVYFEFFNGYLNLARCLDILALDI